MCKIIKTVITIPCYFCAFYQLIITRYRYIIVLTNQTTPKQKHLGNSIDFTLSGKSAIMIVTYINCINQKGGDNMEVMEDMNNAEIMKNAMDEFEMIQRYMVLAKKEKATETYAELKNRYLLLKALLNSLGVNLIEIDKIKE